MERMQSKFPFSMENIPRQKKFGCLSLRFGCIFSALVIIIYTILALAQCTASMDKLWPGSISWENRENVIVFCFALAVIMCHCVTLMLTALMLVGVLREKMYLIHPWIIWTSLQVLGNLLLIVFWTTVSTVPEHMNENTLLVYVIAFVVLMIRFYMLMLVASFYKQLEEENYERLKLLFEPKWCNA